MNVCGDSENAIPDSFHSGNQYSLQRLQVEVDQFFLRAAQQIISAHRYSMYTYLMCTADIQIVLKRQGEMQQATPPPLTLKQYILILLFQIMCILDGVQINYSSRSGVYNFVPQRAQAG